jgi:hypothetical protein
MNYYGFVGQTKFNLICWQITLGVSILIIIERSVEIACLHLIVVPVKELADVNQLNG